MGNADSNIQIVLQTQLPVYYAGSAVDGYVHINAKEDRPYDTLYIRLEGKEFCQCRGESIEKKIYQAEFILTKFKGFIRKGHYSFPFSLLLPGGLPASWMLNNKNQIRYKLSTYLSSVSADVHPQKSKLYLGVREPPRIPPAEGHGEISVSPELSCCGCCYSGGMITARMAVNCNSANAGDKIVVQGWIDNRAGKVDITGAKLMLTQRFIKVNSKQCTQSLLFDRQTIQSLPQVKVGILQPFSLLPTLPTTIKYTAIGTCIARYFTLDLVIYPSCSSQQIVISQHIIINTSHLPQQKPPSVLPPPNWNPTVAGKIQYANMPIYHHRGSNKIPFKNQSAQINPMSTNIINPYKPQPNTNPYNQAPYFAVGEYPNLPVYFPSNPQSISADQIHPDAKGKM